MEKKILFTIAYDGTHFSGWQRQKNDHIRTVQACFEDAAGRLFGKTVTSLATSRTDAGVHAFGQRAVIIVDTTIPVERMPLAINSFLPEDISAWDAKEVPIDFHPQYAAKQKTYEYKIFQNRYPNPVYRNYSEFIRYELDILKMQKAAEFFIGEHDFKAFAASGNSSKTTIRTIYSFDVLKAGDFIILRVTGNGFLYNMVRIIAGTLIYVGIGKILPEDIPKIILSGKRALAGKTAGPGGLTLIEVKY